MRLLLFVLFGVVCAASRVCAQNVHLVDGVHHLDVDSAYRVAAPGDMIFVSVPSVPAFHLQGKGVIVRGTSMVSVDEGSRVRGVPADQTLVLENLRFGTFNPSHLGPVLAFTDNAGAVVVRGITVIPRLSRQSFGAIEVRNCAYIGFSQCTVRGGDGVGDCYLCTWSADAGLIASGSSISFFESTFQGGSGPLCNPWCPSQPGVDLDRCVASAIRCHFEGGYAMGGFSSNIEAGMVLRGSRASLAACTAYPWLDGDGNSHYRFYGAALSVCPYFSYFCSLDGYPIVSVIGRTLPELRAALGGGALTVNSIGSPSGSLCFVAFSARPSFFDFEPSGNYGALLLDYGRTSGLLAAGVNDSRGNFTARLPLPPALFSLYGYREIFLQSLSVFSGAPWLVSNLMGFHLQ